MHDDLRAAVAAFAARQKEDGPGYATALDGLSIMRSYQEVSPEPLLYRPALCLNVQGSKQAMLGQCILDYGEMQFLVVSLDLPIRGRLTGASPERPFLGIKLDLDLSSLRDVAERIGGHPAPPGAAAGGTFGLFVADLTSEMAGCVLRLVRLLETPEAIPVVAPAVLRELHYWLLTGPHGEAIRRLIPLNCGVQRIATAIRAIREDISAPVRVAELARLANMSVSSFHQHFRAVTAMSPLQFQKRLRLLAARELMLDDGVSASGAAFRVGYESASQFSREYARLFGAPPKRDVLSRREGAVEARPGTPVARRRCMT